MRSLITLPNGTTQAVVDVYRDGKAVVLISKVGVERTTEAGTFQAAGGGVLRCENIAVFELLRNKAKRMLAKKFERAPAVYARIVREFDLDRDVRGAEELPDDLRPRVRQQLLPAKVGT